MSDQPKSILVGMTAREEFSATPALAYATALARQSGSCLTVCALPPAFYVPVTRIGGSASAIIRSEVKRLEEVTSEYAREAAEFAGETGISCIAEHRMSPLEARTERLARLARVNDITVLDAADAEDNLQRAIIEDVLFDSGRPILVVPRAGGKSDPNRIVIAWDGSARSARAVGDAMPFLQKAANVFIVTVTGEKDLSRMAPGADVAAYLVQHGVQEPRLEMLSTAQGEAAERLRKFVKDESIEMMVMGAFVHSRFRQAILGGVTRSLLDDVPVPLFMAY